jgi:TPR repeat protein
MVLGASFRVKPCKVDGNPDSRLAEGTRKPTQAAVIPLPAEPTTPDRLAQRVMGDEHPAPANPSPLASHAEIVLLLARGYKLLTVSDVVSARLFFARAAAHGNAQAMTALASTYDPLVLASGNVRGVHPEPREAISGYQRAAAAGDATAGDRLHALVDVLRQSGQIEASESAALLRVGEQGPHNTP